MRILRYVSDIHLEYIDCIDGQSMLNSLWDFKKDPNDIYYLALLGDIGNPFTKSIKNFFQKISPIYDKIFYIPGNHEYYNLNKPHRSIDDFNIQLKNMCQEFPNIILMNNEIFELDDVAFIGSTLWSNISESKSNHISKSINDYHLIKKLDNNKLVKITTDDSNKWNIESIDYIQYQLKNSTKSLIILTHHAPLFSDKILGNYTADPCYINSLNNEAFHNDLSKILNRPIIAWLYGHTHYTSKFIYNSIIIATNQLGYCHERNNFNPYAYINIDQLLIDNL